MKYIFFAFGLPELCTIKMNDAFIYCDLRVYGKTALLETTI